ncbi:MAG: hypothetical protein JW734_05005 [Candidatus Omnitrophica bacterium]|nr:hypothetical protein [Candidatus Omnitrophota bacterium]
MKSNKTFTVIEVLIAVSILLTVIVLTGTIFRGAILSWGQSQVLAKSYQSLKNIFLRISKEVSSSVRIDQIFVPEEVSVFKADSRSIFFIYPAEQSLREVGYLFDVSKKALIRRESSCDFDFNTFDKEQEIGFNIESLNFSFFDGSQWFDSSDTIPKAVKIVLTLSYKDFTATYEEIVYIPVGQR